MSKNVHQMILLKIPPHVLVESSRDGRNNSLRSILCAAFAYHGPICANPIQDGAQLLRL